MKRFFCKVTIIDEPTLQNYINSVLDDNTSVNLKGNGRSQNGELPFEYYFSSGLIEDQHFILIETYVKSNLSSNNIFIEWDGNNILDLSKYYDGLKDLNIP